jgi:hypothetical protein
MQQTNQHNQFILKRRTSIGKRPITRGNGFRMNNGRIHKARAQLAAARKDDRKGTSGIVTANGVWFAPVV